MISVMAKKQISSGEKFSTKKESLKSEQESKTIQFNVDDYIDNWEIGIGKVVGVSQASISVHFKEGNKDISFPLEKTKYFKKVDPNGFNAKLYEDKQYLENLIERGSSEIIRLLIIDELVENKRKLELPRIKTLLISGVKDNRGWRKDFGLVKESDWKKWWQQVSKNISKDPLIDTSEKPYISLREKPLSDVQNICSQMVSEKNIVKKLPLIEKLFDICDEDKDASVFKIVQDIATEIFSSKHDEKMLDAAVYIAVMLKKKSLNVNDFFERAHELSFKSLTNQFLSSSQREPICTFFFDLPGTNVNDQILVFISNDEKIRKIIVKKIKSKKQTTKILKSPDSEKGLTGEYIEVLNNFDLEKEEKIHSGLTGCIKLFGNEPISRFIIDLLLVNHIKSEAKKLFAEFVIKQGMTNVVYEYLNKITVVEDEDILFLNEFLGVLGCNNAETAYRQNLLSLKSIKERPPVFFAALRNITAESGCYFNNDQKHLLISHVNEIISSSNNVLNSDIKLEINKIMTEANIPGASKRSYDEKGFSNIIRSKVTNLEKRLKALAILINKGSKDECIKLAKDIVVGIEREDFVVLENIMKAFPEELSAKELLASIIEQMKFSQEDLVEYFQKFIKTSGLLQSFSELILTEKDDSWFEDNLEQILNSLNTGRFSNYVISTGLKEYLSKVTIPHGLVKRLAAVCSRYSTVCLDEIQDIYLKKQEDFKKESDKIKEDFLDQMNRTVREHDMHQMDAINKTSQRYEEHLKKIIPHISELEKIQEIIRTDQTPDYMGMVKEELLNKLALIKQDIELALKKLKIIDRE